MGIFTKARVKMKHSQLLPLFLFLSLYASSVFSMAYHCGLRACKEGVSSEVKKECFICKTLITRDCKSKEITYGLCGCPECASAKGDECGPLKASCASHLTCHKEKGACDYCNGVCVEKKARNNKNWFG